VAAKAATVAALRAELQTSQEAKQLMLSEQLTVRNELEAWANQVSEREERSAALEAELAVVRADLVSTH
jgi:hypothetical protein